ncbi:MAG: SURF1 family protein [Caldilineales bacterium]|nr:SURF1 family protein [Caldilineales bacterium]
MLRTLFSRRYIATTLLVLAAMAVMARLGVWQLDRREQRLARNAELAAKLAAPPVSLNDAASAPAWPLSSDRDEVRNVRAEARGRFDFSHQVILVQQLFEGMPGVRLVAPLVLEGTERAVLVDRGWVPVDQVEAARQGQFDVETGEVTVLGVLQPSQILFGRAAERAAQQASPGGPQTDWYRVDIEALQRQMPYALLPVYLQQAPGPQGNTALPYRSTPTVDLSEGPHLGYAIQWFSFAVIAGVIYVALVRSRERKAQTAPTLPLSAEPIADDLVGRA